MRKEPSPYVAHVFVCTNKKDGKPCCADKNAETLRRDLKEWAATHPEWKKRIRINASGCLDRCADGIAIAIYPQGEYLIDVSLRDKEELQAKILELMQK